MTIDFTQTVLVGKTDLPVPRFGLGTAPIGNLYEKLSDEQAVSTIHYALEQGVNFLDTAPLYGEGLAEHRLGQALAGIPRDSYILQTKVGRLVQPDGQVTFNYSRDEILRSIEASLERLKLDRIDILLVHDADVDNKYDLALNEAFPTLVELREQGVIKAVGAGMNQWEMEWDFARHIDVNCFLLAGRYTLLEQTSLDFLDYCQQNDISIFLGGVYNSGILAIGPQPGAKYNYADAPADILARVARLQAVCERYQVPLNVAALNFPLAHPAVTSLVVGAIKPEEVAANIEALQTEIPAQLWADLEAEGLLAEGTPKPS